MKKYRVVHIGTGFTGTEALKGVLADPALELAGWWVSSPSKAGMDAGELCGLPANGVRATRDLEQIYALKPDCLCYAGNVHGRELEACKDVAAFLERGINVVSFALQSMVYPPAAPKAMRDLIEAACVRGGSTFYASGSEPGLLSMSLPAVLLSGAGRITGYREQQFVINMAKVYPVESVLRESMGFGKPMGTTPTRYVDNTAMNWWKPHIYCIAGMLGTKVDSVEFRLETGPTARAIRTKTMGVFEAGTIGAYRWELMGMIRGTPAIVIEYVASLTPEVETPAHWPRPAPDTADSALVYRIEGRPSFKTQIYLDAPPGESMNPSIPMTGMHVVNAIPLIVEREPGVVYGLQLPYYFPRNVAFGETR